MLDLRVSMRRWLCGSRVGALALLALAGCMNPARADSSGAAASCPAGEPAQGARCAVGVGASCVYTLAATREVFCHCIGTAWDCGTPLGIDSPENAPDCPASVPATGSTCTMHTPDPPGSRAGCRFQAAATPITRDCVCAHMAPSGSPAVWDCTQRAAGPAVDARGCLARQPVAGSLCTQPEGTECVYGYNLSTNCVCRSLAGGAARAWSCHSHPQPPSPGGAR